MPRRPPFILLELNEVNFDFVRRYVARGELPNFSRALRDWGITRTRSESRYEELEPWIQWVTAHTGRSYAEHGVFRLGDIVGRPIDQIWELLERRGLRVGAVSPINAENRLRSPAFFLPDPWTNTPAAGSGLLRALAEALRQTVNDNATSRITPRSLLALLTGLAVYARPRNYAAYLLDGWRGLRLHWPRAIFLDRLIADIFIAQWKRERPDFASLFLNGCAHIQHHYLFNSKVYDGPQRNPAWYVDARADPTLEVLRSYDRLLGDVIHLDPAPRVLIATGLHQTPIGEPVFYWRLRDHAKFLHDAGLPAVAVEPRMSRDFLIRFATKAAAREASAVLNAIVDAGGLRYFEADHREDEVGTSVFAMLVYPADIPAGTPLAVGTRTIADFRSAVAFVAIKNAEHDGTGFVLDSGRPVSGEPEIPLGSLCSRVLEAFA